MTLHLSAMVLLKVCCILRAHLLVECATGALMMIHVRIMMRRKSEWTLGVAFKAAQSCQSVQMTLHLPATVHLTVVCILRAHLLVECAMGALMTVHAATKAMATVAMEAQMTN